MQRAQARYVARCLVALRALNIAPKRGQRRAGFAAGRSSRRGTVMIALAAGLVGTFKHSASPAAAKEFDAGPEDGVG